MVESQARVLDPEDQLFGRDICSTPWDTVSAAVYRHEQDYSETKGVPLMASIRYCHARCCLSSVAAMNEVTQLCRKPS